MNTNKKFFGIIFVSFILILLFANVSLLFAFPIYDAEDDVAHFEDGTLVATGDFHDEIDIVSIKLVGTNLELFLQATPVNDDDHRYTINIYWDGDETTYNKTHCDFSSGQNVIETHLKDGQTNIVAAGVGTGLITISGEKLVIPILNYSLIQGPSRPYYVEVNTKFEEDLSNVYRDKLEFYNTRPGFIPSYTFQLSIIALMIVSFIAPTLIKSTKKRHL